MENSLSLIQRVSGQLMLAVCLAFPLAAPDALALAVISEEPGEVCDLAEPDPVTQLSNDDFSGGSGTFYELFAKRSLSYGSCKVVKATKVITGPNPKKGDIEFYGDCRCTIIEEIGKKKRCVGWRIVEKNASTKQCNTYKGKNAE